MSKKIIKRINLLEIENPLFLKDLKKTELKILASDIREFIINSVSQTGGHLSSNLGTVELEIALHYVFNEPNDKIIFDVGHQSYTHKILTGRANKFNTLRQFNGLSGYPSYNESSYDVWESGHSSTSISALEGFLIAQSHGKDIGRCVAFIGDSSISNGVSFEALNNLSSHKYKTSPIIILNDNGMGINKTVGAITSRLQKARGNKFLRGVKKCIKAITIPPLRRAAHSLNRGLKSIASSNSIFGDIGFDYYGPYDGHNLWTLIKELNRIKKTNRPVIVHVLTKKGYGYLPAENDNEARYHGIKPFDVKTGVEYKSNVDGEYSYTEIAMDALYRLRKDNNFMLINSAMNLGKKVEDFNRNYPGTIMDVGIAEEHAAVVAAGLSRAGEKAVLLYYSTFLQRAYDEILNDIARSKLNVLIGIDRAGIVGEDGSTHQGIYDIAMLSSMPNMIISMGMNGKETRSLFKLGMNIKEPMAIRYPRGNDAFNIDNDIEDIDMSWTTILDGKIGICITYGPDVSRIKEIIIENNLSIRLVNARFIRPIDEKMLNELFEMNRPIFVYEQVVKSGSLYEKIIDFKNRNSKFSKVNAIYINENQVIPHGSIKDVMNAYGLGDEDILRELKKLYEAWYIFSWK